MNLTLIRLTGSLLVLQWTNGNGWTKHFHRSNKCYGLNKVNIDDSLFREPAMQREPVLLKSIQVSFSNTQARIHSRCEDNPHSSIQPHDLISKLAIICVPRRKTKRISSFLENSFSFRWYIDIRLFKHKRSTNGREMVIENRHDRELVTWIKSILFK
jgi:hypothetical protein